MTKFINAFTGTEMWVSDDRVDEYKAAGHKPAAEAVTEVTEQKPAKKSTAKKK